MKREAIVWHGQFFEVTEETEFAIKVEGGEKVVYRDVDTGISRSEREGDTVEQWYFLDQQDMWPEHIEEAYQMHQDAQRRPKQMLL